MLRYKTGEVERVPIMKGDKDLGLHADVVRKPPQGFKKRTYMITFVLWKNHSDCNAENGLEVGKAGVQGALQKCQWLETS